MKRELILNLGLVAFGGLALPALVFVVGQQIVGDYEGESGVLSLYADIYASLMRGEAATFALVLGPLLVVTLLRLTIRALRPRKLVNHVTN